ncbi:MAG TPA: hypothetical protein VGO36_07235 [Solirubrobacterales bacterium]|nr:hypothetical protein [Solirubrobacterales bacterium]
MAVFAASAALLLALLLTAGAAPATAASLAGKDGKIHACYKAKGKGKGTLRVVPNAKARCPRHWKKTAWNAAGAPGASGEQGNSGENGSGGESGSGGNKGDAGALTTGTKVASLETKVTELLSQVKSLEAILSGLTNTGLKEAVAKVPVVTALCGQTKQLNEQTSGLGSSLGAFNTVLGTLIPLFSPVSLPAALPAFSCP